MDIAGTGGCDPPSLGWAKWRFPDGLVAARQGKWLAQRRAAGLALAALGDYTCQGNPEPLGACGPGLFCSRDSFTGCFPSSAAAKSLPRWQGARSWHGCGEAWQRAQGSAGEGDVNGMFLLLIQAALSPPIPPSCRNTTRSNRSSFTCSY